MANQAVYGIAKDQNHAERIITSLMSAGVKNEDISILYSNQNDQMTQSQYPSQNAGHSPESSRNWRTEERLTDYPAGTNAGQWETSSQTRNQDWNQSQQGQGGLGHEKHSKAPEGATTGATTGGLIGGTLGLLAGIGALAIPGLGPFIAAGPLMATLSGIGAGGMVGGLVGALVGSGIPEFEAKRYENRLKEGGTLIAIRAESDDLANRVKEVLQTQGAEDVSVSSEASMSKKYNKHS
jgi:hypothetical protein